MIERKVHRKHSILFSMMLIILVVVVAVSSLLTILLVHYRTKDLIDRADAKLLTAAEFAREVLGPDYHDRIVDETSVSNKQFRHIVARNDDLCQRLNLQYLWSVLLVDGRIVFTSATHSNVADPNSPCASFFETHRDPESFAPALLPEGKISFSTFKNEWGKGRQILIPRKDANGRTYIFGASIQLTELNDMIRRSVLTSLGISLAIIAGALLLAMALARSFIKPVTLLTEAAKRMTTGEFDVPLIPAGPSELQSLAQSLDQMQKGLKQRVEELRESEGMFRSITESAFDMIALLDLNSCYLYCNPAYIDILGYSPKQLIGENAFTLCHPDERDKAERTFQEGLATKRTRAQVSLHLVCQDGSYKWVEHRVTLLADEKGNPQSFLIMAHDITERKRAEDELRASQQIIKGIINAIPVRVFWKDKNLRYLGCNTIFARDAGFDDPKDIIGKDDYQMVWRNQAELYRGDDLHVIESGSSKLFIEEPQTTPEGNTIMLLTSKIPLRNFDGEIIGVLGTYMDITDRKHAEDQIKASLKEKEVLLKEIQHRVKNNLLTISGILALQLEKIKDDESKDAFITSMNRINAMTKIHTRLYQSEDYSLVHFKGYMEELLGELSRSYGFSHENLIIDIQDISLDVNTAIPTGLIVNELVGNAMKHAFPNGNKGPITVTLSSEDSRIVLTITDNGIGLPPHIDFRSTESVGFSLLGLLVEQINGSMELVTDMGTRFIITFSID